MPCDPFVTFTPQPPSEGSPVLVRLNSWFEHELVSMTATALLSVAFGVLHKAQGSSSRALGPGSELLGPKAAY